MAIEVGGTKFYKYDCTKKKDEYYTCAFCRNARHTKYYYADLKRAKRICPDCINRIREDEIRKQNEALKRLKETAETLKPTTILYFGIKNHRCNGSPLVEKYFYFINGGDNKEFAKFLYCEKCKRLFITSKKVNTYRFRNYRVFDLKYQDNIIIDPHETNNLDSTVETVEVGIKDFITRTSIAGCIATDHDIRDIVVNIKIWHSDYSITEETAPAIFCKTCGKYYLLESEYDRLCKKGILLCNVVEIDYWVKKNEPKELFFANEESILHKLGYNVNASVNLPMSTRHRILESIVLSKILTKAEICAHLDYLINRSKNNPVLSNAVKKWKTDREFVGKIDITKGRKEYSAKTIVHKNYKYH